MSVVAIAIVIAKVVTVKRRRSEPQEIRKIEEVEDGRCLIVNKGCVSQDAGVLRCT